MVPDIMPSAQMLAPQVTLELCRHGGHVWFLSARSDGASAWWLEQRFEHYLAGRWRWPNAVNRPVETAATWHRRS